MAAAKWLVGVAVASFSLASLGAPVAAVATTSIVGDVVKEVGGERVALAILFPPGTDPHTFEPTPQDLVALSR
ncbi:MAG: zinc ABC transporter substrate-binding protein, partial [Candidatus Bipolaricaulis anaerobius]|nr:zinc ABC transporter substrate-binding protein [Candidatus Bipolaricaulis anaerobius]